MTNDEYRQLVEFLGERFTVIDRRFEAVDRRFDGIDQRLDGIDQRLDGMDQRLDGMDRRLDAMDRRFETNDFRLASMQQYMDRRFEALQESMDARFREVLGQLEALYGRVERLEQEYQAITHSLRRIEALLTDERGRRQMLERRLEELKDQVLLLQARIAEVERRLQS
jgi:predicted  nucleic acid-binding Zn-ribbon protein